MKNLLPFLLFIVFTVNCLATEEKLSEVPWRAIVETYNTKHSRHWVNDITIKLFGNYSAADSLMVANSIKQFNDLCETIQIGFSELDRGNLEIFYLDSVNSQNYEPIISLKQDVKSTWNYTHLDQNAIGLFKLALNNNLIPAEFKQNYLTNKLAFALYPTFWRDNEYDVSGSEENVVSASIFRSISIEEGEQLYLNEMQSFDKSLLRELYSKNFDVKLDKALEQYPTIIKVPRWLRANSKAFFLLPVIIILLLLLPLYMKVTKIIAQKIPNKFVSFNCSGIIGVLVLAIIGSLYFSISDAVRNDVLNLKTVILWSREIFLPVLLIGIPAINILRLAELLIHKNTHRKILKVVLIFLSTGLIPFASVLTLAIITIVQGSNRTMSTQEIEILAYFFIVCITIASFRALISYFFFKEKDLILENETKLSQLRELKTKAELDALHSRINPHFLYNSLNSIAGLAHINANKTEHMALSLSKLFRYSINKENSDWTTFKEELEMVRVYLDVEKVRFDDRLTFSVEIDKELEEQNIPRFIIQPLVENAVKHGISKSIEGGEIRISISKNNKATIIAVSDSGKEFSKDLTPGFGLQSIYDKLEILYKDKFEMSFANSPLKQVILKLK